MDSLFIKAALAGVFFGAWPLFMNRSGLNGSVSSLVFTVVVLVCVAPFAIRSIAANSLEFAQVSWTMAIVAGVTGAVGVTFFNGMLSQATPQSVGTLFVVMIIVQTAVPAIYSVVMNGGISLTKAAGFALAGIAAVLLTRP
ncbi:MAG TPA: hypothetical protein PK609_02630 [Candidatus Paceibacterota bacterium]|nr:hypothetical protein [Candidatus Paceibacterota bacterium]